VYHCLSGGFLLEPEPAASSCINFPLHQLSAASTFRFAFHSLRAKLTKIDVTANTSRSSPRV
jgi:hypothetical protein